MSTEVFAEWYWKCDGCDEFSLYSYDSRAEAELAADAHECEEP